MKLLVLLVLLPFALGQMPGAPVEQNDTESADIQALAEQAVAAYNQRSNDLFPYVLVRVVGVKTQVVSGVRHELQLEVAQNKNCRKGAVCADAKPTEPPKTITANVLSQPWKAAAPQIEFS